MANVEKFFESGPRGPPAASDGPSAGHKPDTCNPIGMVKACDAIQQISTCNAVQQANTCRVISMTTMGEVAAAVTA